MNSLENLDKLMQFLHRFQNVKRVARIPGETEYRNAAEHSFEVVMLAWYITKTDELELDLEKVMKYALAHDLLEAYAGDSYIYDKEAQETKEQREHDAVERIKSEFLEFEELSEIIHAYEKKEDAESKFVYALDKLVDPLNSSLETGQSIWKDLNVSYGELRAYKDKKIEESDSHVLKYWKQLVKRLEDKIDFYFPK